MVFLSCISGAHAYELERAWPWHPWQSYKYILLSLAVHVCHVDLRQDKSAVHASMISNKNAWSWWRWWMRLTMPDEVVNAFFKRWCASTSVLFRWFWKEGHLKSGSFMCAFCVLCTGVAHFLATLCRLWSMSPRRKFVLAWSHHTLSAGRAYRLAADRLGSLAGYTLCLLLDKESLATDRTDRALRIFPT